MTVIKISRYLCSTDVEIFMVAGLEEARSVRDVDGRGSCDPAEIGAPPAQ
jgi:hypothetical protein